MSSSLYFHVPKKFLQSLPETNVKSHVSHFRFRTSSSTFMFAKKCQQSLPGTNLNVSVFHFGMDFTCHFLFFTCSFLIHTNKQIIWYYWIFVRYFWIFVRTSKEPPAPIQSFLLETNVKLLYLAQATAKVSQIRIN